MIELINGHGQLGDGLRKLLEEKGPCSREVAIYHTWNVWEKDNEGKQREEFEKFKRFVDSSRKKIIFISTYTQKENYYNYYKHLSEAHLIANYADGFVIRLPVLIGKGICQKLRDGDAQPFGGIELLEIEDAARQVTNLIEYEGLIKTFRVDGYVIPAKLVKALIDFGKSS